MSGTRSHSLAAPATEALERPTLLIVAHGERGGNGDDRFVHSLVQTLQRSSGFAGVRMCFISKEPSLQRVLGGLRQGPVMIYPLFMSDGYFVRKAIPHAITAATEEAHTSSRSVTILTPLGLNPRMPTLVADLADVTAQDAGCATRGCQLLLVAHGSRHDAASRRATLSIAEAIKRQNRFAGVDVSFLEEHPFLDDEVARIAGPAVAVGLFASQGMHGGDDLPEAIRKSGRNDVFLAPPLTHWPGLSEMICSELDARVYKESGFAHALLPPMAPNTG